jgi:hypothetical protein
MYAGDLGRPGGVREAAEAARAAPPGPEPPRAVDVLLDAVALRVTEGYHAAAAALTRAVELLLAWTPTSAKPAAGCGWPAGESAASSRWSCGTSSPGVPWPPARFRSPVTGALVQLQFALSFLGRVHMLAGELARRSG